jgi:cyclopropane fatty-acyl-phospholipid synthase-like methyltransferase
MAIQKDNKATYDNMDKAFRQSIHRNAGISCAIYNCNIASTLEEAQRSNHEYILHSIGVKKSDRILDIVCGRTVLLKPGREPNKEGIG